MQEFINYHPLVFNLNIKEKTNILSSSFDVLPSNKMEILEQYSNRKKIYLVTSLFEKNIDYKEETETGIKFTSIDDGIKELIKDIKPDFPQLLNRAFLKLWEILFYFDLIPETDNFVSSHLAEGPGSFIQATILFREMQAKLGLIKSVSKDDYYGVTLHSDHEHLLMHQEFIKYFSKESKQRLHIMETKSINDLRDMYGGGNINNKSMTNGDITKINTIRQFAGSKDIEGFAKPSDFITSDGGFDWKSENLQEQEAYRLIFGEVITALKLQKNGGSFVIKIFESFTKITIKIIELLRQVYETVYIVKPYTSRISNSEKYIVCKNFNKSIVSSSIVKKLEEQIKIMNKFDKFNILDLFTDIDLSNNILNYYRHINTELYLRQYLGINNIKQFIDLDNHNGIEYNNFLDKQIMASHFWNNLFLNTTNIKKINKYFAKFNFIDHKHELITLENSEVSSEIEESEKVSSEIEESEETTKNAKTTVKNKASRTILKETKTPKNKSLKNKSPKNKSPKNKSLKNKSLSGGGRRNIRDIESSESSEDSDNVIYEKNDSDINSSDEKYGGLDSDEFVDLNNL